MLRKKSEIAKTGVAKRQVIAAQKMRKAKEILREYFEVMDLPSDEDGLVRYIAKKFEEQKSYVEELDKRYEGHKYPEREQVEKAHRLIESVLSQRKDNMALINRLIEEEFDLQDSKEDLQDIEGFFKNQVQVFDAAAELEKELKYDGSYLKENEEADKALNEIRKIVVVEAENRSVYKRIPELNGLMATVRRGHDQLLDEKREEIFEIIRRCLEEIHTLASDAPETKDIARKADHFFDEQKEQVRRMKSLQLLDGLKEQIWSYREQKVSQMESMRKPEEPTEPKVAEPPRGYATPEKKIQTMYRQQFPAKILGSPEDVDGYVERIRAQLTETLKNYDGIEIK